jgi:voltage-gated potassium channel
MRRDESLGDGSSRKARPARSQERYDQFAQAVDVPMLVVTLLWLPVLIVPLVVPLHGAMAETFATIDYIVWALFALEYITKLSLAPQRGRFVKTHLLDLLIVAVPFFRPLRMGRLVRLLRLARVAVVVGSALRRGRSILTHNGFHFVVLAAATVVFVCAGLVTFAERTAKGSNIHDFGQGLWWAVETVTTVGYGDRYPTTAFGQGVSVLLMLVGIGLIGTLTATVASYFVQERSNATEERLERIETLLSQLVGSGAVVASNSSGGSTNGHEADASIANPQAVVT